jgi:hypothetical protein
MFVIATISRQNKKSGDAYFATHMARRPPPELPALIAAPCSAA